MALQDRTEAATPKRRQEAREEGKVAKSQDITSAVVLLISLMVLKAVAVRMFVGMKDMMQHSLSSLHTTNIGADNLSQLTMSWLAKFGMICLPLALTIAAVGLAANVLQVGLKFTPKAIVPKFSNVNPISGLMKLVGSSGIVELAKSLAKVLVVTWFTYSFIRNEFPGLTDLAGMQVGQMGATAAGLVWRLMMRGCIAMLVIGIIDYVYQKYTFEQSLKMTKQEVIEEYKRSEGDPKVKGRIRQRQAEMARRRMMQDVPKSDVIITNPTHFAIAIKYDSHSMSAPKVVAKGQRLLALKIRSIAEAHGVPIVENPPVARLLYKTVEIGEQVPEELYQTVAEILAYVYQMSRQSKVTSRM